jgi:hypothetical protein
MPAEDLLRYIGEPLTYSRWWLVIGVLGIVAVIAWCLGVYAWTRPTSRLQRLPAVAGVHTWLVRRRFENTVRGIGERHRSGALTDEQACAELSGTLRSFLAAATGTPAPYMHLSEIAVSGAPLVVGAAPLLEQLTTVQFDPAADADMATLLRRAEELIASWS